MSRLPVDDRRHLRPSPLWPQGLLPALSDLRVLILVLDHGAPLLEAPQSALRASCNRHAETPRVALAPRAQGQMPGRLGAGVEVLVEPAAGRAVDAAGPPVDLHHGVLLPRLLGSGPHLLG